MSLSELYFARIKNESCDIIHGKVLYVYMYKLVYQFEFAVFRYYSKTLYASSKSRNNKSSAFMFSVIDNDSVESKLFSVVFKDL